MVRYQKFDGGRTRSHDWRTEAESVRGQKRVELFPQRFTYEQTEIGVSSRDRVLTAPTTPAGSYSRPRTYFSSNYALVTWLNADNSVVVVAYTWAGRWLESVLVP